MLYYPAYREPILREYGQWLCCEQTFYRKRAWFWLPIFWYIFHYFRDLWIGDNAFDDCWYDLFHFDSTLKTEPRLLSLWSFSNNFRFYYGVSAFLPITCQVHIFSRNSCFRIFKSSRILSVPPFDAILQFTWGCYVYQYMVWFDRTRSRLGLLDRNMVTILSEFALDNGSDDLIFYFLFDSYCGICCCTINQQAEYKFNHGRNH